MKIAICDDEAEALHRLESHLCEYPSEITAFHSAKSLLANTECDFDIIFLDIEMDEMNGFEAARQINFMYPGKIFAFFTSHTELAPWGYEYRPFRYILKTDPPGRIKKQIDDTVCEYYHKTKTITVSYKNKVSKLRVKDILYIEIFDHIAALHTPQGVYHWYQRLKEIEKLLSPYRFIRCHKSYIVNLYHARSIVQNKYFMMTDKTLIPIGKTYKPQAENDYIEFYFN